MSRKADKGIVDNGLLHKEILQIFRESPTKVFTFKQLAGMVNSMKGKKKSHLVTTSLERMMEQQQIVSPEPLNYQLNLSEIEGQEGKVITITGSGGFIKVEDYLRDVFVTSANMNNALVGDLVKLIVFPVKGDRRPEGAITQIVERSDKRYVGVVELSKQYAFVVVNSKNMPYDIFVPLRDLKQAKQGEKVLVEIVEWTEGSKNPVGRVLEVLGQEGDHNTEMHAILAEFDLPYQFSEEVEAAANSISTEIPQQEYKKRLDMRQAVTFTIDPFDAKDFDDAISVEKLADGKWRVGVHIADVSHYIIEDSVLDQEAFARATSVYLVDRVVPMLPEMLSNGLCSLRPNEEKLCFSAIFEINEQAEVEKEWFGRTIINSNRRFTYEEAQQIIETKEGDYKEEVLTLHALAQTLREERFRNGSLSFERDEAKFKLDEQGKPLGVYFKVQKESNQLVEEFMLLANKKVAEFIGRKRGNHKERTFVYRIHDRPNTDKFNSFCTFIAKFGYSMRAKTDRAIARELNKLLAKIKGTTEENLLSTLALRSMAKAVYSTDNIGHYGLAFDYYTHFTSPIRRYPDVMVHRLLQHYLDGGKSVDKEQYEQLCNHSTEREIKASEAERASIKYKMVEYMSERLEQEFVGFISGVTEWGIYVELEETKIEGMVSVRDMKDDFYDFDESNYRMIGNNTRRILTLGDKVKIRVSRADLKRKQLDYELVSTFDTKNGREIRLKEAQTFRRKKR